MYLQKSKINKILLFSILLLLLSNISYAQNNVYKDYSRAIEAANSGQIDFAFMHYRSILKSKASNRYKNPALFASGEYYYMMSKYDDAFSCFEQAISTLSPYKSNEKLFSLAYLLKLAEKRNQNELIKALEKEIITFSQQSFVFRKFKEYNFKSPLNRKHKAIYSIDQIKFFVEGELFAKISY